MRTDTERIMPTDRAPRMLPLSTALVMAEAGISVRLSLVDATGAALWEAAGSQGLSRLHAAPPADVLARTHELHIYVEQPAAEEDIHEADVYLGLLGCGCTVQFAYRPALTAHCPTHGARHVRRVDYPYDPIAALGGPRDEL